MDRHELIERGRRAFERRDYTAALADFREFLNPASRETVTGVMLEPALGEYTDERAFQLERLGYFCLDSKDAQPGKPVLNRTIELRDSWAKIEKQLGKG